MIASCFIIYIVSCHDIENNFLMIVLIAKLLKGNILFRPTRELASTGGDVVSE